jgi:cytochrome b subunit of formate dehydrogenase
MVGHDARRVWRRILVSWGRNVLGGLLLVLPVGAQAGGDAACEACHDQGKRLKSSIHASLGCTGCHEKHEQYPHPAKVPKPACTSCHSSEAQDYSMGVHGRAVKAGNQAAPGCSMCHGDVHETAAARTEVFRKAVPDTCGMCHDKVAAEFKASVHGKAYDRGIQDAPLCTDCHGEHGILPPGDRASSVSAANVSKTCGRCHGDVRLTRRFGLPADRITSFESSFHGLASRAGSQTVANCASCHGVHNILPSSDPKSMIYPGNLPATCGKCHPGAGSRFALGQIHITAGAQEPDLLRWARLFYLSAIPATIGLMLLHHGGDWIRKLIRLRLRPAAVPSGFAPRGRPEMRMFAAERIQHGLLAISFFVLVWTGFALKYPDQWWARPLVAYEGSWPVRGTIHRIAAGIMMAVSVFHAGSLVGSRRLRDHWKTLIPVKADLYEGFAGLFYALGVRREKPVISVHSYIEKVEYWAVVWGTAVMGATGVVLWANNWSLKLLPKVWIDLATTIHFYEAVLASLAILVWHFYSVIFDPDVYPLDPAFLTGFSVRQRQLHAPEPPQTGEADGSEAARDALR